MSTNDSFRRTYWSADYLILNELVSVIILDTTTSLFRRFEDCLNDFEKSEIPLTLLQESPQDDIQAKQGIEAYAFKQRDRCITQMFGILASIPDVVTDAEKRFVQNRFR